MSFRDGGSTLHLLGAGKVGRAFLRGLGPEQRLVAVSDRSGTIFSSAGLDPRELADFKEREGSIGSLPGAASVPLSVQLKLQPLDVVVDCTDSAPENAGESLSRALGVLRSGSSLVTAAKNALAVAGGELLQASSHGASLGINAVLGGTGAVFLDELRVLRESCREVACVPNVTTTAIIEFVERGGELADGLEAARSLGYLEGDPEQDLRGDDAASKLLIVGELLFGTQASRTTIELPDLEAIDPELLRRRSRDGRTTRLVARCSRAGTPSLRYEEVPRGSTLAVPGERVVYCYGDGSGGRRVHVGAGVGPAGTARALLEDVARISARKRQRVTGGAA